MAEFKFPILYSRAKSGAVQTWQIIVDGNSYYTISGQQGGAQTRTNPTVVKGKTRTTGEQQAMLDAESKFTKKKKKHNFENIDDIDKTLFIEPMLANKLLSRLDKIDWKKGLIVQLKYNGKRLVSEPRGLFSRTGEPQHSTPHIWEAVKHLFLKYPDLVIDGEAYNYEMRQKLNDLMSIVNSRVGLTEADIKLAEQIVKYYVYDGYGFDNVTQETGYEWRIEKMANMLDREGIKYIVPEFGKLVHSWDATQEIYQYHLDDGQEGIIGRIPGSPYINGRCNFLLKMKPTDDAEAEVTDITEGVGDKAGLAARVFFKTDDGRTFKASVKGGDVLARQLLIEKDKHIGKQRKYFYNGLTGLGIPNYAQFDMNDYDPTK